MPRLLQAMMAVVVAMMATACGGSSKGNDGADSIPSLPTEAMVIEMYNHYIKGEYSLYVDQMQSLDDKPESYRKQMADLMKQRHRSQEENNVRPVVCRLNHVEANPSLTYANAFLDITYEDSTKETILVPLVHDGTQWRLK